MESWSTFRHTRTCCGNRIARFGVSTRAANYGQPFVHDSASFGAARNPMLAHPISAPHVRNVSPKDCALRKHSSAQSVGWHLTSLPPLQWRWLAVWGSSGERLDAIVSSRLTDLPATRVTRAAQCSVVRDFRARRALSSCAIARCSCPLVFRAGAIPEKPRMNGAGTIDRQRVPTVSADTHLRAAGPRLANRPMSI